MAEIAGVAAPASAVDASYRMLFERHPLPMWVYDLETVRFLDVNDAAIRSYGYTRDEFLARRILDIRPASERARLEADLASPREAWAQSGIWTHCVKSGAIIDVQVTSHTVEFGGRAAVLVTAENVTDRVATERRLCEREEQFRLIAETVGEAFWISDARLSRVLYVSPAFEQIWGIPCERLLAEPRTFIESVHPDDRDAVRAARRAELEGQAFDREFRIVRPDGEVRWVWGRSFPVINADGTVTMFVGTGQDVTARRAAEHAARDLEQQLEQSQKMESLGQLAGSVAHDFNNMLTAILGNAAFLLDELPAGDARRTSAQEIQDAGRRAAALTGQLLAFSRKKAVSPRAVRVQAVIDGVTPMLRRLLGESIDLRTSFQDGHCIMADPSQIEQVLVNLAVNARDAMPDGGRLTISTADVEFDRPYEQAHPEVHQGRYVTIRVTDTGHGMTAATRKRIFEPFFTTKAPGKGTGLGLATAYGAIAQAGGHIDVQSAMSRGTTFTIYLPHTAAAEARHASPAPATRTLRGNETVLVVEDEAAVRTFTELVLRRYGYAVHCVSSPAQAFEWLDAQPRPVDLVVTDVVLPEMNGPAMARRLRQQKPDTRVLYMSGYAPADRNSLEPLLPFLAKPFTGDALARSVREALEADPPPR